MLNPQTFMAAVPELQRRYWPHVNVYEHLDPDFQTFFRCDVHQQCRDLEVLRQHPERHGFSTYPGNHPVSGNDPQ